MGLWQLKLIKNGASRAFSFESSWLEGLPCLTLALTGEKAAALAARPLGMMGCT